MRYQLQLEDGTKLGRSYAVLPWAVKAAARFSEKVEIARTSDGLICAVIDFGTLVGGTPEAIHSCKLVSVEVANERG